MRNLGRQFVAAATFLALTSTVWASSENLSKSYSWRSFDGTRHKLTFEILRAEIAASEKEFGLDPADVRTRVAQYSTTYSYTPRDANDPARMAEIKRKAENDLQKQKKQGIAEFEARVRSRGFCFLDERTVAVDIPAVIDMNKARMAPFVEQFAKETSAEDRVSAALAFVQRMPYRAPASTRSGRHVSGFLPPLETLATGYGDCDSKAALFISLASTDGGPEIVLLRGPDHMLVAVECDDKAPGFAISAFGKRYLVCECSKETWLPGQVSESVKQQIKDGKFKAVRLS